MLNREAGDYDKAEESYKAAAKLRPKVGRVVISLKILDVFESLLYPIYSFDMEVWSEIIFVSKGRSLSSPFLVRFSFSATVYRF